MSKDEDSDEPAIALRHLLAPAAGTPAPITTAEEVLAYAQRLANGSGPVALDAERASGYTYSARAQLIQINRAGAGLALIDPVAIADLSPINAALQGVEWVLHAAIADLECLAEVGLRPDLLFDTELGGRLAGFERVSLGAMAAQLLGLHLAKGHSAADWSIRPLPKDYLTYAALDVEILVELRDEVERALIAQGKLEWAHEEFEAVRTAEPPPPRIDPWRRTSGLASLRGGRALAIAKLLWETRDALGQRLDIAPSKLLTDRSIIAAAAAAPRTLQGLLELDGFTRRGTIKYRRAWFSAVAEARALPESDLPPRSGPSDNSAPPSRWMTRDPAVAARFQAARAVVLSESERLAIPAENLVPPGAVRSLAWELPDPLSARGIDERLQHYRARDWQRTLLVDALLDAFEQAADASDDLIAPAPQESAPESNSAPDPSVNERSAQ